MKATIEKRQKKRKVISLDARIISDGAVYNGIIINMSEEGIFMVNALSRTAIDFTPGSTLKLVTQLPTNEIMDMDCSVKWFQKKSSPVGPTFKMGMEIINPPLKYREFVRTRL